MVTRNVMNMQAQFVSATQETTYQAWLRVQAGESEAEVARSLNIPDSTLRKRLRPFKEGKVSPELYRFFWSVEGRKFLLTLIYAILFFVVLRKSFSIETVSEVLRRAGLHHFMPTSYGSLHAMKGYCESLFSEKAEQEYDRMTLNSGTLYIVMCADETWLSEMCLIAIDPVSGFILLGKYCDSRSAERWAEELRKEHPTLNIEVILTASDEAKGLIRLAEVLLEGQHAPDLFHVQHEASKGLSLPLANDFKQSEKLAKKLIDEKSEIDNSMLDALSKGESLDESALERFGENLLELENTVERLNTSKELRDEFKTCLNDLGLTYHPIDINTGDRLSVPAVMGSIYSIFGRIEDIASQYGSEKIDAHIEKAKRVCDAMDDALKFYELFINDKVEQMHLSGAVKWQIVNKLIPAAYLERVSNTASNTKHRDSLIEKACAIREKALASKAMNQMSADDINTILESAKRLAHIFQRSSSCVEGINGLLSLKYHASRGLSEKDLKTAILMLNYVSVRADGKTAAERLFGIKQRDMFTLVLEDVPELQGRRFVA